MSQTEDLKKTRAKYVNKIFWLCLNIIFIFLIPALAAIFFGKKIDAMYNQGVIKYTNFLLLFSFIFSWFLVITYYKKISRNLKDIDERIKNSNAK